MTSNSSQQSLFNWFMRRIRNSGIRRIAELPISIASDTGLLRSENQDRAAILRVQLTENHSSIVVILCDGMGGMNDGTECACLAVTNFLLSYVQNNDLVLEKRILASVENANDTVFKKYEGKGGATLSAFIADTKEGFCAVNVGDSRIYSIEQGQLSQLTTDDTILGQFTFEDKDGYGRNELLQYIGMGQGIEPHIISFNSNITLPDILLTSDGLHFLDKPVMEPVIKYASDYAVAIQRLIDVAKWYGGHDNASGIIISNLSSLITPRSNFDPKLIEIWDAFGDIQILNQEKPDIPISESNNVLVNNTTIKNTKPSTKRAKKPSKSKKTAIADKKNKPKPIKNQKDVEAVIPELQINFELDKK